MSLRPQGHRLVTNAKVQHQVWAPVPIVLQIASEESLSVPTLLCHRCIGKIGVSGLVLKEPSQRRECERSAWPLYIENIVLYSLKRKPEFQGVGPSGQERVVIELEGVRVVKGLGDIAQGSIHQRQTGYGKHWRI